MVLETFHLEDEPAHEEVVDAKAYGDVHLRCFVGSRWGPFWAERIRANMEDVRALPVVWDSDDLVLMRHEVLTTQWTIAIPERRLVRARGRRRCPGTEADHWRCPAARQARLQPGDDRAPRVVGGCHRVAEGGRELSAHEGGRRARPPARLWCEAALEHGRLEPAADDEHDADHEELWVEAVTVHEKLVPGDVVDAVVPVLPNAKPRR